MYEVIYIKADYEPWWMFEGWEQYIISHEKFDSKIDAQSRFDALLFNFREKYSNENNKTPYSHAFWSNDEKSFCDYCDEDLQIFHGLFVLFNGVPIK